MNKPSDVRVEAVAIHLRPEQLAEPLQLSRGAIDQITYAQVRLTLRTRAGQPCHGQGAILLSDLWAFPDPAYPQAEKARAMQLLCGAIGDLLQNDGDYADPLVKGRALEAALPQLMARVEQSMPALRPGAIPYLAGLNCLAPFDAALHDGWGRALGGSGYAYYTADHLNADLAHYLGAALYGRFPADFLHPRRRRLTVQHLVGVHDDLTFAPEPAQPTASPANLASWIRRAGLTAFKLKARGQDPYADAQRLIAVYELACALGQPPAALRLSLDTNEACAGPAYASELLDRLAADAPAVLAALDYIEQPTSRDLASYTFTLHEISRRKPVIIDESLDRLEHLALLAPLGWSGLAVKSGKGQTHSLLAYCWGKQTGQFVTMQDLTNPGLALVHSANLCAHLNLAVDYFECNSLRFMPAACPSEQAQHPTYFHIQAGQLFLPEQAPHGLY